jgi:hypothetical protein
MGSKGTQPANTVAIYWPIEPALDDRWWWCGASGGINGWKEKPNYSEETRPGAALLNMDPTWHERGSNPSRRGGKPGTIRQGYGLETNYN